MPEIAEIALTSEILSKYFQNKILTSVDFITGRYSKTSPNGYANFLDALPLKIKKIDSMGKFMWFELVDPQNKDIKWYIWNTFGLTGMWSLSETKYTRAVFTFKNKKEAFFSDMRNFGTFKFSTDLGTLEKKLRDLSPDFLKDNFTLQKVREYDIPIVKILMDQKKVGSGLGNYLTAEILYRARISPYTLGPDLSNASIKKLTYWTKYIVKLSYVDNRIGYMVNLEDEANKIQRINYHPEIKLKEESFQFMVYRKKFDPKGNPVAADKIGTSDRTTYWVPNVQN